MFLIIVTDQKEINFDIMVIEFGGQFFKNKLSLAR